jgi:hypothetical protein
MAQKKKAAECSGDGSQKQTSNAMIEGNRLEDALATNANPPSAALGSTSRLGGEGEPSGVEDPSPLGGAVAIKDGPGKVPNIRDPARFPLEGEGVA